MSTLLAPSHGRYAQRVKHKPITNRHTCRYPKVFCLFFFCLFYRTFGAQSKLFSCLRNVCLFLPDKKTIASNDGCILRALKVIIPFQSFQSSFSFFFFFFFFRHPCVQVLHTPEKTTIPFLSQVIEMPLNQNKSLTPGGGKVEEKKLPQTTRSRPMSSYGGHCAFIVAVHVAQRQRQVRIEFVFVRERKKEEKKNQANKRKETKQTNGVRKERRRRSLFSRPST